jgi:hypothetical protein
MKTTRELLYSDDKYIIGTAKKVYNAIKENFLIACMEADQIGDLQDTLETLREIESVYLSNGYENDIILLKECIMTSGFEIVEDSAIVKDFLFDLITEQKLKFAEPEK